MAESIDNFAPPPFNANNALTQLKRSLRDLKLVERNKGFDLRGKPVVELVVEDQHLQVQLARKLALTPEWDRWVVNSMASQRKLLDELQRRMQRWDRED